jgi:hypothetical protein
LPLVFRSFFFQSLPLLRCTPLSFYKARTGGNGRLQWVSVAANGWNASAFNGRAVAEEEDGEQSLKTTPFSSSKGCFQFGPWILIILQSSPWLKHNWILAFPRHFQAGPWVLMFAIWTPIKPQTLIFFN